MHKCAVAVQSAKEMEFLKQEAEGKLKHLDTKLLQAQEEVLSLKVELCEGAKAAQTELDRMLHVTNEKVKMLEKELADEMATGGLRNTADSVG